MVDVMVRTPDCMRAKAQAPAGDANMQSTSVHWLLAVGGVPSQHRQADAGPLLWAIGREVEPHPAA